MPNQQAIPQRHKTEAMYDGTSFSLHSLNLKLRKHKSASADCNALIFVCQLPYYLRDLFRSFNMHL